MKIKEKHFLAFKYLLIAILIVAAFSASTSDAEGVYSIQQYNKANQSFIKIVNKTNYNLYCTITGYQYFRDFTLYANRSSRWYPEPYGEYEWRCR